ncbi:MAG TPA: hypothetical protein VK909_12735 [Anaerolineales bacterium]|nr:hypothetical protein [Anaerolineales bacterium]
MSSAFQPMQANGIRDLPYALIDRQLEQKFRWLSFLWIAFLYVAGLYFWCNFLNWTRTPLDFQDWGVINVPRLDFFRDALRSGQMPLHMNYGKITEQVPPLHGTDRYFSVPDVITTPQSLLLLGLTINQFVLIDLLLHFTLASLGLLWFRRKYGLSLFSFGILFLLFNFNGYIQSHYAVGHITWMGYFLFPFFIALVIQAVEEPPSWIWVAKISFLLLYMLLVGSQHHFTWTLIFLSVLALVCWKKWKWIFWAGLSSGLLGAIRLLPPILILQDMYTGSGNRLLPGYPVLLDVLRSLAIIVRPDEPYRGSANVGYWEFDIYVGLMGTLFLLYFGVYQWLKNGDLYPSLQKLFIPTVVIFLLTIGKIFAVVRASRIPFFEGERAPSRMIGLPLTVIIIVAVIYYHRWLEQAAITKPVLLLLNILLLAFLANDLWAHARVWNLESVRTTFGPVQMLLSENSIGDRTDRRYLAILLMGMLLSVSTGLFLAYRIQKERQLTN